MLRNPADISMVIKLDASLPMELVVNIVNSELELDDNTQTIYTNSFVIDALFPELDNNHIGTFSAHAMVGYSDNGTERRVMSNTGSTGYYDLDSDLNTLSPGANFNVNF